MNTLFQFIMYLVLGKHWVLYDMRQGLKMAIMVNEAEVAMHRNKIRVHQDTLKDLEGQLATIEATDPLASLPEPDTFETPKAYHDAKKKRKDGYDEAVADLKGKIQGQKTAISGTDGELQRIYNIAYHNRLKYDFLKSYKPRKSYADN